MGASSQSERTAPTRAEARAEKRVDEPGAWVAGGLETTVLHRLSREPRGMTARQIAIDCQADAGSVRRALGVLVAGRTVTRVGHVYVARRPLRPQSPPGVDRTEGGWGSLRSRDA